MSPYGKKEERKGKPKMKRLKKEKGREKVRDQLSHPEHVTGT